MGIFSHSIYYYCNFDNWIENNSPHFQYHRNFINDSLCLTFYKCPTCNEIAVIITGVGEYYSNRKFFIKPTSNAKQYPDYIPLKIRQDYEEACAIVNLSPKSSATLSRRCLQSMIRDFWGIKENRLVDAINKLQDKVPVSQWLVIDAIRKIGNIGAHPDTNVNTIIDIDPQDAQKLIAVIELLISQWYIERYEREKLYNDVLRIKDEKENLRKK